MSRRPKKKLDGISNEDFRRQVKERRIEPLYLFAGEEQYLQERALKLLFNTVDEAERAFNIFTFTIGESSPTGAKTTARDAIGAANEITLSASRRIIVVREFDKIKEDDTEMVLEYLKRPAPSATVVFQTASLDQRRKLSTALLKAATVVAFDRLSEQQAARWAEGYLKLRDCRIEPAALGLLIGLVGTRLSRLANELDKLAAYAGGGFINSAIVQELVPRAREHTTWELWDAILERNRKRALRLTQRLLDDGDASTPLMILGALAGLYRRLLAAKDLMARGAPVEDVNRATGRYGRNAEDFNARVRRSAREEIVHGLRRIAQVDNAIKNSEATPRLQIEYLVAELTLPESARWSIFGS
ncbi:MAG TPA: DNA polymerase III subunit delta [Blastocatellia bacterium]|nr:DNA polymerase III subunit delta [Blastocatellia bacterium]